MPAPILISIPGRNVDVVRDIYVLTDQRPGISGILPLQQV